MFCLFVYQHHEKSWKHLVAIKYKARELNIQMTAVGVGYGMLVSDQVAAMGNSVTGKAIVAVRALHTRHLIW